MSGLTVAAVADTPKVMSDGNWRLGVVIDAAASDEQAEKLGGVFSGALGGPMEALGPLIGENLGVERAPIEVREDGLNTRSRSAMTSTSRSRTSCRSASRSGEPARLTGIFHPAGPELTWRVPRGRTSTPSGSRFEGKSAFSRAQFSWRRERSAGNAGAGVAGGWPRPAVRARLGIVALLFALAALAWCSTADRMAGMDAGPGTDLGTFGWFVGIWVVMMAAMMFPSVAPTVAPYSR